MSDVMVFVFNDRNIRAVMREGEPWFVAADACRVLDLDTTQTRRLDEDEKGLCSIQTPGGTQSLLMVNEAGLYSLVLGSRKPEAKAFKRWITHEVLPSIRKHGMYATDDLLDNPDLLVEVATRLRDERKARLAAEARVAELTPKAEFHDAVAEAKESQSIRDIAKVLGTGQNRLFAWLRGQRILMADNQPYQDYIDAGYFRVIEQTWEDRQGGQHLTTKTLVTGKGLTWLQKRWKASAGDGALQVVR